MTMAAMMAKNNYMLIHYHTFMLSLVSKNRKFKAELWYCIIKINNMGFSNFPVTT